MKRIFVFAISFLLLTAVYHPAATPAIARSANTPLSQNTPGVPSIQDQKGSTATPTPTTGGGTGFVTVDFNTDEGPVTYRASGFIGITWIPNETPQQATYLSTKPRLATWMTDYLRVTTAEQNNIEYQFKLHKYNTSTAIYIPSTVNGDWSLWENYVRAQVQQANTNHYQTVEFDIWNEPDCCGYWPYGTISETNDDARYYEMWNRTYRIIKSVNPNFKVVGPSVLGKLSWIKAKFLPRVKAEGTMPDILSWHQITNTNVSQNVSDMRAFLATNNYAISKISINEYGNDSNARKPGVAVQYMYELEKAKVDSASRACWQEGGDWNCPIHMGNTLLYDFASQRYPANYKRSVYWAYKAYADMTGRLVSVGVTPATVGIAAKDSNLRKGYLLLGSIANASTISIQLKNLNNAPFYVSGSPIDVTVSRIPNTENNALAAPIVIQHANMNPNGTELTLTIQSPSLYDAYAITLASAPGPVPTSTLTPTPAGDSQPPVVSITSPANGAVVTTNSTVNIQATASDNVGVTKVEFYVSGKLRCTDLAAPFACAWVVPAGPATYQIQAKAFDARNNTSTHQIMVTSSN